MFGDVAAYGCQAAALAYGALVFVQPLLVCGLLVALPLSAHWTGQRLKPREYVIAGVLCVALALFLNEASSNGGIAPRPSWNGCGWGASSRCSSSAPLLSPPG